MEKESPPEKTRGEVFADHVIKRLAQGTGFGARLRRADNPATEYQAWEYLINWCDIEKPWERLPFVTIAAALARAKPSRDGNLGIGKALAACYEDKNSGPATARLRRLLACDTVEEACRVLRPMLRLVQSKGKPICYGRLLDELLWFGERRKARWATDYYGRGELNDRNDVQA